MTVVVVLVLLVDAEVCWTRKVWFGRMVPAVLVKVPPFMEYSLSPPETLTVSELVKPLSVTVSDWVRVLRVTLDLDAKVNAVGALADDDEVSGNQSAPQPDNPITATRSNIILKSAQLFVSMSGYSPLP